MLGGLAHIFLTESYRYAPASVIAPFDYTTMLWALLLGYCDVRRGAEPSGLCRRRHRRRRGPVRDLARAPARTARAERESEGPPTRLQLRL